MAANAVPKKVWKNGEIIPYHKARVGLLNHTFNYGTGVFEGIRFYWNDEKKKCCGFRVKDHYNRILKNAAILGHHVPFDADTLASATLTLIRELGYQENLYVRPLVYIDNDAVGIYPGPDAPRSIAIVALPFGAYIARGRSGLALKTSTWRRMDDTMIPPCGKITGAYANSYLAVCEAREAGADEAMLLTNDNHVAEGSGENIFIVRYQWEGYVLVSRVMVTPPSADNILLGITRDTVMTLAPILYPGRLTVREASLTRSDILSADECFLTGTACEIAPVLSLDGRVLSVGIRDTTRTIQETYLTLARGDTLPHHDPATQGKLRELQQRWLTEISFS